MDVGVRIMPPKSKTALAPPRLSLPLLLLLTSTEAFSPPPPLAIGRTSLSCLLSVSSSSYSTTTSTTGGNDVIDDVDLLVIGGGISGLAAAITASEASALATTTSTTTTRQSLPSPRPPSVMLLESSDDLGGRVRTDVTADGYVLDRGFAVFVEDYPSSRRLLDYGALELGRFEPGALVRLRRYDDSDDADDDGVHGGRYYFASLSDPLRRPHSALETIFSSVCGTLDKLRLVPLFLTVLTGTVEGLFDMDDVDAKTCLREKYGLSREFVDAFFAPFIEGIYLTSLENISSRMLHFVMKMFAGGYASLPRGGMRTIVDQLKNRAIGLGVDVRYGGGGGGGEFVVRFDSRGHGTTARTVRARSVVIATDVDAANGLLMGTNGLIGGGGVTAADDGSSSSSSPTPGVGSLASLPPRCSVGCLYYGFPSPAPILDPVLILNGEGRRDPSHRNTMEYPINNVCFPSRVQQGHAPVGYELCCVSILENALVGHGNDIDSLDKSVRRQLSTWFSEYASDIIDECGWIRKGSYLIDNAQPANYHRGGGVDDVVMCANVHGGRDCSTFRGVLLPRGIYVCGDHMATSTLNGALESGVNAGDAAARFVLTGSQC
ncbi:hypothetical protein ACHAXA_000855 [Cyclostephanos tholiformis]|uniref:Amine oxidase domain-containing protein n=1 Tax=Cyclostephanos tholiformis TaxID=382380 RepID=A0ABD3SQR2_9STRA